MMTMPMMPMMMPGMTPHMMQQQMAMMQQQMQAMMSGQFPAMMPPAGMFGMPGMPGMQMPQMPGVALPAAPAAAAVAATTAANPVVPASNMFHPAPVPSPQSAAVSRITQPATAQHTVPPLPAMPMMPVAPMSMPMPMMNFGMPIMPPQQPKVEPQWVVSKAAPVVAAAPIPVAAPPKPDVFGDLSNPDLALRKERFVIEQTKVKTAPPASAGVRAEDDEEEEFADFTSGEQHQADDFSFGPSPPTAGIAAPQEQQSSSASNELSFDPEPAVITPAVAPLPKQDLSADALMSKAFGMFEHKTNAPLVAQASMSQIASHTSQKASHAAVSATHKGKRDMPQDLDDLLNNLVGGDTSAPTVELPSLGAEKPKPVTAAATAAVSDDDEEFADFATASSAVAPPAAVASGAAAVEEGADDEDFADFSSSPPISASTSGAAVAAPKASPVAVEEDDDEGFSDFGSAQPAAAPQVAFTSFSPPTSSFGVPTSSFGGDAAAPQSSFSAPQSSFTTPQLSSYTSPPPAFAAAPAFVPKAAYQPPQQAEAEKEDENEDFADFSSAPSTAAPNQPAFGSDPFGSLGGETSSDPTLASLSPEIVVVPPPAASPAAAEGDDEEDEEDFADFSSAPASSDPTAFDVHAVDPAVAAAAAAEAETAAAAEAAPQEPKKEEDLIGGWGTTKTTKKSNPFAIATPEAAVSVHAVTAPPPIVPSPAPSFDDVFGSLVETEEVAAPVLPDLLLGAPLSSTPAARVGRGSITTAQAVTSSQRSGGAFLAAPSSARPAGSDAEEDGDDEGFGGFASSASDGAKVHASFVPSSSFDSLTLEKSPLSIQASPAPVAFELSEEAKSMTLPTPLQAHSRVPPHFSVFPRQEDAAVPSDLEEAMAFLMRQERFTELIAAQATRSSSSQLTELQAKYKSALAAAEEDESDDGAQLAEAMALQKQIKRLKALKPDEKWMRPLTAEEQLTSPASYDQIQRTLVSLDPDWERVFVSLYPESFASVAATGKMEEAVRMQMEANALLKSILGPSSSEIDTHAQRMKKVLTYIQEQLQKGDLFAKESSQLDLADPSKHAEFVTLLSAPSSPTVTFLSGLATLYRILLKIEFSNAVFEQLQIPKEEFEAGHQAWLSIIQHLHSAPLKSFLGDWLISNAINVDSIRQKLKAENAAEQLAARRGRHSCPFTLVNQEAADMKDPSCAALHSQLRL